MHAQIEREREWCWRMRAEHYTLSEISAMSRRPPELGGVGAWLSTGQVRKRITDFVQMHASDFADRREALIAQEVDDLDRQYRAAAAMTEPIDAPKTIAMVWAKYQIAEPSIAKIAELYPDCLVHRDDAVVLRALETMRRINERKAKLLGLDATEKSEVSVTVKSQADAELEEMLAEAGVTERAEQDNER